MKSLKEKIAKKKSIQLIEAYHDITISALAPKLRLSDDQLYDVILECEEGDDIESYDQPIKNYKIFKHLADFLKVKFEFKRAPGSSEDEEKKKRERLLELDFRPYPINEADLEPRPPVVAIMGHIDHGKTTLLDQLRKSSIVAGEFGGITQHIGAFSVSLSSFADNAQRKTVDRVTFIDTPGHAAFKAMRSRGAQTTDIVVLVVDACEGVLEQTEESIRMIKEAGTAMVVAINKIDKPGADVNATMEWLQDAGVPLEAFGGDVQAVPISALQGQNMDKLVGAILSQADKMELKGEFKGTMEGKVIESNVDPGLGKVATVLVTRGSVTKGDIIVVGKHWAKVRALVNDQGQTVSKAELGEAVKIAGFRDGIPSSGEDIYQVENERRAKEIVQARDALEKLEKAKSLAEEIEAEREKAREEYIEGRIERLDLGLNKLRYGRGSHFRKKETLPDSGKPRLSLVIKADFDGSLEAILDILDTYNEEGVDLDLVDFGVGVVSEKDLDNAASFNAVICAFNTQIPQNIRAKAAKDGIEVAEQNIIYKLVDDLKVRVNKLLPLTEIEDEVGTGKVLQEFLIDDGEKKVPVAGCKILSGKLDRGKKIRVTRKGSTVYEGPLRSLKHLKKEVKQIESGSECGIMAMDPVVRFEAGDEILCFETRMEPQETKWSTGF